jgi:hypothetical protein
VRDDGKDLKTAPFVSDNLLPLFADCAIPVWMDKTLDCERLLRRAVFSHP